MARKIPKSRRHKKLKFVDPCYSGPPVTSKKKRNILYNEPPSEEDCQEVPYNMQRLINIKNQVKQKKFKRLKKKKAKIKDDFIIVKRDKMDDVSSKNAKPLKRLPERVVQKKDESQFQFINRLQQMADQAIAEAKVEQKYDINLVHVDKSGNAKFVAGEKETGVKKKEKRKQYKQRKKEKRKNKETEDFLKFPKDDVKFGEVVLEPPTLSVKPKKVIEKTVPGKRSLILNKMLHKEDDQEPEKKKIKLSTMKRKKLSVGQRRILEQERQRVVDLYRALKVKNKKNV